MKSGVITILVAALVVSGCAAPGEPSGPGGLAGSTDPVARCAAMGLGGALLGAVIAGKNGAAKGAALGLAACVVVEVASRQTKTAAQVDQQFRVANRNQLPPNAKLDAYTTAISPNGVARAGEAIKVQSTIRAVSGSAEPVQDIKEVLIVYAPGGQEFKRGEKRVNESGGSGEYENSFTLRLPEGAPQGDYKLRTQVYLNGRLVSAKESNLQVA